MRARYFLMITALLVGCSQPIPEDSVNSGPLEACPSTPNCYRDSIRLDEDPEAVTKALMAYMAGNAESDSVAADGTIHAVFKPGFIFRDDLTAVVLPDSAGVVVHIRSASRTGYSDLGVNKRRVNRLVEALSETVHRSTSAS